MEERKLPPINNTEEPSNAEKLKTQIAVIEQTKSEYSMKDLAQTLIGEPKERATYLLSKLSEIRAFLIDLRFKTKEKRGYKGSKLQQKGVPRVYKSEGKVPFSVLDFMGYITDPKMKKLFYSNYKEGLSLKIYHPQISLEREFLLGSWQSKGREFTFVDWKHIDPEDESFYHIAASLDDPAFPPGAKNIRGFIHVYIYIYMF